MQIAFWSPNHGQTGTTTAAITYATTLALTYNFKVLLSHSHFERSTLENALMKTTTHVDNETSYFSDHGLSALKRLAKNSRLNKGMISDYTTSLLPNMNLDLLEGLVDSSGAVSESEAGLLREVFRMADEDYDFVIVDIHSGLNMNLSKTLIEDSDIVVVCLNQNTLLIDRFMANEEEQAVIKNQKVLYNIGFYEEDSKYRLKNLMKLYGLKDVMVLPYHPPIRDAANQSQSLEYLLRLMDVSKKHKHYGFVNTIKEGCAKLMATTEAIEQEVFEKHA